jgi:hypothetical protein
MRCEKTFLERKRVPQPISAAVMNAEVCLELLQREQRCFVNAPTRSHSLSDVRTERNNAALHTAEIVAASHRAAEIE